MLAKHNIKTVALPPRKIYSYLPPIKDTLGLRMPGVDDIPYECGKVFILDKVVDLSKSESNNKTDIYD
jgi:hypothetical protein